MIKLAGIDVGNDSVKIVLDGSDQPIVVPNVIAPGYERLVLQEEDASLKALDVMVYSPSLSKNNQRYFVGLMATEHEDKYELEETDNKALSDQSLIVALTTLAYVGLISQPQHNFSNEDANEVEFILGTGLPVRTYARFHKTFKERLLGEHEVTFLSTPKLRNRRIKVIVKDTFVSIEGAAALFNMATHDSLQVKDEELYYGCIGVCEIGALTTDFPVIKRMAVDNHFSSGEYIGLSSYLDSIIRDVEDKYGYSFASRSKLVQKIKSKNYSIQLIGEGQEDIKPIVDNYFHRAADRIVDLIKKRWKKYPDIQCFYVIGGGATALRPYIEDSAGSIKLRFVDESEFQNVLGYLKMAKHHMKAAIN